MTIRPLRIKGHDPPHGSHCDLMLHGLPRDFGDTQQQYITGVSGALLQQDGVFSTPRDGTVSPGGGERGGRGTSTLVPIRSKGNHGKVACPIN